MRRIVALAAAGPVTAQSDALAASRQMLVTHAELLDAVLAGLQSMLPAELLKADSSESISSICCHFGVWDFGRFAAQYQRLFGTTPSRILRR